ncbi:hypothetical protein IDJ77_08325 [Mucilaginibacter sp. ZT4R22]|uniref:MORN repeat protein n=1 Tax=Mucilaginibacter pankratovii TaxID=2772110 RepID=A0ABR7WND0_9SPHI|nr:hypothetical protein [Mucilaginibacter pankratovii]MBD1363815.1 hypothetical protein [Mucilaginibacter pankratovii]
MKYFLIVFLSTILWLNGFAQEIPETVPTKVRINGADRNLVFEVKATAGHIITDTELNYYWYASNAVHNTRGGYSGKLLNGEYAVFFPGGSLKEQGGFKNGLTDGVWKSWTDQGLLISFITWAKGRKWGAFTTYDAAGKIVQQGNYINNLLDGELRNYISADSVQYLYYRNGVPVSKKPSIFSRLNPFSKSHARDSLKNKPANLVPPK